MLYGFENNILISPFSFIISIILVFGISLLGETIHRFVLVNILNYPYKNIYQFYSPLLGSLILIYILFIPLILDFYGIFFLKLFSSIVFLFGLLNIYFKKKLIISIINFFKKKQSLLIYLIIVLYILLFFVSASPITHADSLDYHYSGALNLLNYGHFHKDILPINNILVSAGEIIISTGLFFGAEQLGGIVQFSSLLSLIPIFFHKEQNKIFLLNILICPITLFLVSSPKPQLICVISSLLIFIYLSSNLNIQKEKHLKKIFFLIIFTLSLNFLIKFSFIVSSTLLGLFSFYYMIKHKETVNAIFITILVMAITILPFWIFKYNNFETGIVNFFLSPLPINIYSFQYYHDFLTGGEISYLSMLYPLSFGKFTTTFGPLLLIIILMINKKIIKYKISTAVLLLFFTLAIVFGSNLNRFLYEGFLWLIFLISITYKKTLIFSIFKKLSYLQTIFIITVLIYFVATIFPGSLNNKYKSQIMSKTANGYDLAVWVNSKLNKSDVLLSTHRSISLFNNQTYSTIFLWGIDFSNKKSQIFIDHLKLKKINRIVFYGKKLNLEPFQDCIGNLLFYGENIGKNVGRNPFNQKDTYNGWIYELDYKQLDNCLISN